MIWTRSEQSPFILEALFRFAALAVCLQRVFRYERRNVLAKSVTQPHYKPIGVYFQRVMTAMNEILPYRR